MMDKPIKPKQFTIKAAVMIPATITYQVMAIDESEALQKFEKNTVIKTSMSQQLAKQIKLKATVYIGGTSTIKKTKIYRTIQ